MPALALAISDEGIEAACAVAREHAEIFGDGNYYLELMSHGIEEQERVNEGIREVSRRTGIPLVATNDIHYVSAEDAEAQDIMVCIQSGKTVDTPDRLKMIDHPELYMKTAAQMAELFPDDATALENTLRIADQVDLRLPLGELRLPHFEVPAGRTPEEHLRALAEAGVAAKYGALTSELRERIDRELAIIAKTGYAGYILIVQDFIRFAQERGILTAVRGSAGCRRPSSSRPPRDSSTSRRRSRASCARPGRTPRASSSTASRSRSSCPLSARRAT